VVVVSGGAPVRFEPSESGTVHFSLPEGAVVTVLAVREAWQQVQRADGRRGWVAADAMAVL
jgi:SH3-like domain-containing protein